MEILVIGGGPGGYVAAIRAAQLGMKVALVEKGRLGGTCLQRGCIPTKALNRNAKLLHELADIEAFGISRGNISFDLAKAYERKNRIVSDLESGVAQLLKTNRIEHITGHAEFIDPDTVRIEKGDGEIIERKPDRILVATGSRAALLPIPGCDLEGVVSSDELLEVQTIPESMLIIGGGVIGIEFANIFNAFGTKITVVEFMPQILPGCDSETVKRLAGFLKRDGITIETGIGIETIGHLPGGLLEAKSGEKTFAVEKILFAVGRAPVCENIGLEAAGIHFGKKGIKVDANYRTNNKKVYAFGDVVGGMMLAHLASAQGTACVEAIAAGEGTSAKELGPIPACVFTFPGLACVGFTEDELKRDSKPYKAVKTFFRANGKALTLGESDGFVKLLFDPESGEILGTHILGPHADDLIQEAALAIKAKMRLTDVAGLVHAHPGLPEAFHEAACAGLLSVK